ncbi:AAA domain-containing protein [Belliella kenyensis]|uniref:AAA domain-containing protein n=1 Tax=Belliella kenyensis TaxID=1472724 RepID=A0ABV8EHM8_9BACT|nr:AAA domain-containing protein [Belliella kenyensis]MCH7401076.1 AAA domain-containing protein [Belliella kenyensis]MDN3604074.1 AAA domain-containing protein [Belliella kenyensis]
MLKETFQIYLNRLTDISSRNRSLYLPKLYASQLLDVKSLDFLNHHPAHDYIKFLLNKEEEFTLHSLVDPRDQDVNISAKKIRAILQQVNSNEEETGEKSLYLGYPFVEGKMLNGQLIRCPLVLFPISVIQDQGNWVIRKDKQELPFFNKAFCLAYESIYGSSLIKNKELSLLDIPEDPRDFLTMLYELIKVNFSINFNSKLYENVLEKFPESSRELDLEDFKIGELKLKPYAVLGQFSQKASFLMEDYHSLLKSTSAESLEDLFSDQFAISEELQEPKEDQLYHVFPLDASQEAVVRAVRTGHSCVVQGPPGTGKSQLISNLVVDYISRGKKVLVVSQKRAALDVVFKRLKEKGFGEFLALVHDFRSDRMALYKKIKSQIESVEQYKVLNRSVNAMHLEREFSILSRAIAGHLEYLEEFKKALYNTEECGVPIKKLYMTAGQNHSEFDLTQYYKNFHWDTIGPFLIDFKAFSVYAKKYQQSNSFWLHRVDFSSFGPLAIQRIEESISEITQFRRKFESTVEQFDMLDSSNLFSFYEQKDKLHSVFQLLKSAEVQEVFDKLLQVPTDQIDLLWLGNKLEAVKTLLSQEGVSWKVHDEEVQEVLQLALLYDEAQTSWWGKIKARFAGEKFNKVKSLLKEEGLVDSRHDLGVLIKKLENRLNLNHQYTLLDRKSWLDLPEKPFTFVSFNHTSALLLEALRVRKIIGEFSELNNLISVQGLKGSKVLELISKLLEFIEELSEKLGQWGIYLSKIQIQHLVSDFSYEMLSQIFGEVRHVFDELVDFDALRSKMGKEEQLVIEKLLFKFPEYDFDQLRDVFLLALSNAWIEHIEAKYPVLRDIGGVKFRAILEELIQSVEDKWKLSQYISEIRLREQVVHGLAYNRLNNLVTYRKLLHQVSKKRNIWAIKSLVENFEEELFKLLPCWMASPETVSALFPLKEEFDLVIFDEASQCHVERGIPAMLRGKQVVIAGDSQQLQPYDFYQSRLETTEEGEEVEQLSILSMASVYFKKFWLRGHYRSEQKSLIQFSNQHFYQNRLSMLVDREVYNRQERAFKLIHVDGKWENQQNQIEAVEVVEEVKRILDSDRDKTIGVITFNYPQMELINEMLGNENLLGTPSISVKNIENVQGDEFDWVIYSLGYAKSKSGRLIANFGSLSKQGGSNRLNVAITRAKKRITLITSLRSSDFKKKQLENHGVKMLRNYLLYVENLLRGDLVPMDKEVPFGFETEWSLKQKLALSNDSFKLKTFEDSSWLDLAIFKDGEGYMEAILTDDERLYEAVSSKEAFVYHPMQLSAKRWPWRYYFSRQFWSRKDPFDTL